MAGTFRDFFAGIAEAMPKMAELTTQYAMFQYEDQYRQRAEGREMRKLDIAEDESAQKIDESNQNIYESKERVKNEKKSIDLAMRLGGIEEEAAQLDLELKKGTKQGMIDLSGSVAEHNKKVLQLDLDFKSSGIASYLSQENLANLQSRLTIVKYNSDYTNTVVGLATSDEDAKTVEELVAKNTGKDGVVNEVAVRAALREGGVTLMTPASKESFERVLDSVIDAKFQGAQTMTINAIAEFSGILSDKDHPQYKAVRKMGQEAYVAGKVALWERTPFVQQLNAQGLYLSGELRQQGQFFKEPEGDVEKISLTDYITGRPSWIRGVIGGLSGGYDYLANQDIGDPTAEMFNRSGQVDRDTPSMYRNELPPPTLPPTMYGR